MRIKYLILQYNFKNGLSRSAQELREIPVKTFYLR